MAPFRRSYARRLGLAPRRRVCACVLAWKRSSASESGQESEGRERRREGEREVGRKGKQQQTQSSLFFRGADCLDVTAEEAYDFQGLLSVLGITCNRNSERERSEGEGRGRGARAAAAGRRHQTRGEPSPSDPNGPSRCLPRPLTRIYARYTLFGAAILGVGVGKGMTLARWLWLRFNSNKSPLRLSLSLARHSRLLHAQACWRGILCASHRKSW